MFTKTQFNEAKKEAIAKWKSAPRSDAFFDWWAETGECTCSICRLSRLIDIPRVKLDWCKVYCPLRVKQFGTCAPEWNKLGRIVCCFFNDAAYKCDMDQIYSLLDKMLKRIKSLDYDDAINKIKRLEDKRVAS